MKTKAAKIFSCCKYELGIFALLCIQAIMNLIPFDGVGEFIRLYYLVDFSMGKASRLLVGSIVSLITDNPTPEWIDRFAVIVLFLTLLLVSVLVGKVVRSVREDLKPQVYLFVLFFVTGSFTLSSYSKYLGFLDIYMFIIAVIAVICVCNKYLRWLVPFLCVAGVFVHQTFAVSYFPLIILAAFYMMIIQEKKAANAVIFGVAAAATVAVSFFCVLSGAETMTVTFEEACEIIKQRGSFDYDQTGLNYIGFYLFNIAPEEVGLTVEQVEQLSFTEIFTILAGFITGQNISFRSAASVITITLFILSFFWAIWIKCIKNAETKGRKFAYACFIMFTAFIPVCCIISTDYIRWVQAGVLTQFGLVFLMFFAKDEPFSKTMQQLREYFKNKKFLLAFIYMVYVLSVQRDLSV